jgi:hypothetical protein
MLKTIFRRIVHPAILISLLLGIGTGILIRPVHADEGGWTCAVSEVTVGNCTCRASGCKKYGGDGAWVCDYVRVSGTCGCPPLELCQEPGLAD